MHAIITGESLVDELVQEPVHVSLSQRYFSVEAQVVGIGFEILVSLFPLGRHRLRV